MKTYKPGEQHTTLARSLILWIESPSARRRRPPARPGDPTQSRLLSRYGEMDPGAAPDRARAGPDRSCRPSSATALTAPIPACHSRSRAAAAAVAVADSRHGYAH